ncbi:Thiamine-monophosphate kinase [Nitrospira sp. KM1]|uniref:thiamine-phosphate kinase n=1 Tax=Nitrospira sp. KM1 TaxID=1936990 RepID=UPI0013A766A1|nr:thiamine-phosphate kinase [Nitrospira sp. KM1]BCA54261.1 Thiamine-monophosphate kinase [Nitrospira sp. KM1]
MSKNRSKARSSLREFDLIRTIRNRYGRATRSIAHGIGDDAAVVSWTGRQGLLTTDLVAEGIHFDLRTATLIDVGYRAAAANLSDIAAMGGRPEYLLVALAIPRSGKNVDVARLYRGIMAACRPYDVRLIGGDTSASACGWFISITLTGSATHGRPLLRSGARNGDGLYVTGTIGDSRAGLKLLQSRRPKRSDAHVSLPHRRFLIRRHLRPDARIAMGQWLSRENFPTSAIDLSDGLSGDLRHVCRESGVGAEVQMNSFPLSPALRAYARSAGLDAASIALAGGEDYELLFTVASTVRSRFERSAARQNIPVTRIGVIRPASAGIRVSWPDGRTSPLPRISYEHFEPASKT